MMKIKRKNKFDKLLDLFDRQCRINMLNSEIQDSILEDIAMLKEKVRILELQNGINGKTNQK